MSDDLKIWSGECCLCDVGIPVQNARGEDLHTGDIVILWWGDHIGSDAEVWRRSEGLTAIVADQYQSFSDGTIRTKDDFKPFVMGIKTSGFDDPKWSIEVVKKYSDVIDGERWPAYGFSYAVLKIETGS